MLALRFASLLSVRQFSSSSTVTKRMELPAKALGLFSERFSSLKLIEAKTNVTIRMEGNSLLFEGEESAVNQAMEKLSPIKQANVQQKDMEGVLTNILGDPVKVSAEGIKVTSNLPRMAGEESWLLRSRLTNSLLLWSDSSDNANRLLDRIRKWSPILEEFLAHKNWKKEVPVHPSFRWADKHAALAEVDAIVDVFHSTARIWAVDDASVDKAAQILAAPYRRPGAGSPEPLTFKVSTSGDIFETVKTAANKLVLPGDESISVSAIEDAKSEVVFNTILSSRQVTTAFQKALDKTFAERKLSVAYMYQLSKDAVANGLQEVAKTYPNVQGFIVEVNSPQGASSFVTLVGPDAGDVGVSRALLTVAVNSDQMKLELKNMPKLKNEISRHFLRILEENVLEWQESRNLRYWGGGIFTVTAGSAEARKSIEEEWSKLVSRTVEKANVSNKLSSTDSKVGYWHVSPNTLMVIGRQESVDEYVQKLTTTAAAEVGTATESAAEKPKAAVKAPETKRQQPEKAKVESKPQQQPAKVTRITVPQPPAEEEQPKIKVTRITAPPVPSHAETGKRPVKVTRISPPPATEEDQAVDEVAEEVERESGTGRKESLKDKLARTGPRAIRGRRGASEENAPEGGKDSSIKSMPLPRKYSGLVVGKHGLVLKGIEQRTKTRIQLRNVSVGEAKVVITGSASSVELAALEINEIIENAQAEQTMRRRAPRDGERGAGSQEGSAQGMERGRGTAKVPLFSPGYRQKVWDTYKGDPERWTNDELCRHFQLTPEHLRGIFIVMKHREKYLEQHKDDEQLLAKNLEEQMIKKCGEATFALPTLERPVCKPHFRFLAPEEESLACETMRFSSVEDELEYNRQQYEEKMKKKELPEKAKPKSLQPVIEVKQTGKFQVVFQQ